MSGELIGPGGGLFSLESDVDAPNGSAFREIGAVVRPSTLRPSERRPSNQRSGQNRVRDGAGDIGGASRLGGLAQSAEFLQSGPQTASRADDPDVVPENVPDSVHGARNSVPSRAGGPVDANHPSRSSRLRRDGMDQLTRDPLSEDEPLEKRVARESVRPVDAGRSNLAAGVEPPERRSSFEVGRHSPDHVVSDRRHGNPVA